MIISDVHAAVKQEYKKLQKRSVILAFILLALITISLVDCIQMDQYVKNVMFCSYNNIWVI